MMTVLVEVADGSSSGSDSDSDDANNDDVTLCC